MTDTDTAIRNEATAELLAWRLVKSWICGNYLIVPEADANRARAAAWAEIRDLGVIDAVVEVLAVAVGRSLVKRADGIGYDTDKALCDLQGMIADAAARRDRLA
jgi:hypothetical protein